MNGTSAMCYVIPHEIRDVLLFAILDTKKKTFEVDRIYKQLHFTCIGIKNISPLSANILLPLNANN